LGLERQQSQALAPGDGRKTLANIGETYGFSKKTHGNTEGRQ
jgi:hypothetical protein